MQGPEGRFQLASRALARSLGVRRRPSSSVGETRPRPRRSTHDGDTPAARRRGESSSGYLGIAAERSEHADRLHAIIATQRDVATADLDLESVMGLLCERTMELTGADGAAVALLRDGELRFGASRGSPDHPVGEVLSLDQSLGGLAIRDRRSLISHDALDDPRVEPRPRARDRRPLDGRGARCCTPGDPVGTLLVLSQSAQRLRRGGRAHARAALGRDLGGHEPRGRVQAKREQVEALNRFRTIFEGASVGIVRARADGSAREVNDGGAADARLLRRGARDAQLRAVHPPRRPRERTKELMRELMAGERDHYEHDKRYIRKDGEVIWVHVRAWLEPPVEGEPRTAIAMIENINERKLAEIALRENSERLERLVETQRDIAAAGVDLDGVMQLIVERSQALTVAEGAIVSMIEGDELVVGAASGIAVPAMVGSRRPLAQSIARYAFEARDTLLIEHAEGDPRLYSGFVRTRARPLPHLRPAVPGRPPGRGAQRHDHVRRARASARTTAARSSCWPWCSARRSAAPPSSRPSAARSRRWLASRPPTRARSPGS